MDKKASEKALERKLQTAVKRLGGRALKFISPMYSGVPDRVILMPGNRTYFGEIKSEGKDLSPRQKFVQKEFLKTSHIVHKIDTESALQNFIKLLERDQIQAT